MIMIGIRDKKSETFREFYFAQTIADAIRTFDMMKDDPKRIIYKQYPEDFDVVVGGFVNETNFDLRNDDNMTIVEGVHQVVEVPHLATPTLAEPSNRELADLMDEVRDGVKA